MSKEKIDKKELIKFAQEAEGLIARLNVLGKESVAILKEIDSMKSKCDKPIVDILVNELDACKAEIEKCTVELQTNNPSTKVSGNCRKVKEATPLKKETPKLRPIMTRKPERSPRCLNYINKILDLKYAGKTHREIAREIGSTIAAVDGIVHRYRQDI